MKTRLLIALLVLTGISSFSSISDSVIWSGNGHDYILVSFDGITWDEAAADIRTRLPGYHLATVTSQAENDFIRDFVLTDGGQYWLGGVQNSGESTPSDGWNWVTSESFVYQNWIGGEPNDGDGIENSFEQHLAIIGDNGLWNDERYLRYVNGYVAEKNRFPGAAIYLLLL